MKTYWWIGNLCPECQRLSTQNVQMGEKYRVPRMCKHIKRGKTFFYSEIVEYFKTIPVEIEMKSIKNRITMTGNVKLVKCDHI